MNNSQSSSPKPRNVPRGPYREATVPVRIPRSLMPAVQALLHEHRRKVQKTSAR
jgi:Na+-transporting methylmalonyl-CoA/oxaloacetate decarboxylase gamma subunit